MKKRIGRKPSWNMDQLDLALSAYAAGETTVRDVKQRFGVPPTTLLRYCRERNIQVTPPGCTGLTGENHPTWKGGFRVDKDGYIRTYAPNHPFPRKSKYVFEHVRIMELHIGRRIKPGEAVHHKDGNRQNNILDNLEIMTFSEHSSLHRSQDHHLRKRDSLGRFC